MGIEVHTWQRLMYSEGNRGCVEDHGPRQADARPVQTESGLVEICRFLEVTNLEGGLTVFPRQDLPSEQLRVYVTPGSTSPDLGRLGGIGLDARVTPDVKPVVTAQPQSGQLQSVSAPGPVGFCSALEEVSADTCWPGAAWAAAKLGSRLLGEIDCYIWRS